MEGKVGQVLISYIYISFKVITGFWGFGVLGFSFDDFDFDFYFNFGFWF